MDAENSGDRHCNNERVWIPTVERLLQVHNNGKTFQQLFEAAQQLTLADQIRLASQIMQLVEQKMPSPDAKSPHPQDPLIGLFSGSPKLATDAKEALRQDARPDSGLTWKA